MLDFAEKDWEIKPIKTDPAAGKTFSADDLIDAYFNGKRDQIDQERQLRIEKLNGNLRKAAQLSVQIFDFIKDSGFTCNMVYLKVKNIYSFTALFLVDEDDYCDDSFLQVYEKTIEIKKAENTSTTFDYSTILTPTTKYFDKKSILVDGYILSYGGGIQQPVSR